VLFRSTITATAEGAVADYSYVGTLPVPTDSRLAILRIASRLSVTIDSDDGTHDLRCRVYVDVQDANHLLYDLTYSTTGNQLAVQDCLVGVKETIFNLLKDGAAHTFYFFFWSPGNHAPVISEVSGLYGVGSSGASGWGSENISITHIGSFQISGRYLRLGTGTACIQVMTPIGIASDVARCWFSGSISASASLWTVPIRFSASAASMRLTDGSVATDIFYLSEIGFTLRSSL
jgi:hypothetical protein